jgi:hypothetical protein
LGIRESRMGNMVGNCEIMIPHFVCLLYYETAYNINCPAWCQITYISRHWLVYFPYRIVFLDLGVERMLPTNNFIYFVWNFIGNRTKGQMVQWIVLDLSDLHWNTGLIPYSTVDDGSTIPLLSLAYSRSPFANFSFFVLFFYLIL